MITRNANNQIPNRFKTSYSDIVDNEDSSKQYSPEATEKLPVARQEISLSRIRSTRESIQKKELQTNRMCS